MRESGEYLIAINADCSILPIAPYYGLLTRSFYPKTYIYSSDMQEAANSTIHSQLRALITFWPTPPRLCWRSFAMRRLAAYTLQEPQAITWPIQPPVLAIPGLVPSSENVFVLNFR